LDLSPDEMKEGCLILKEKGRHKKGKWVHSLSAAEEKKWPWKRRSSNAAAFSKEVKKEGREAGENSESN